MRNLISLNHSATIPKKGIAVHITTESRETSVNPSQRDGGTKICLRKNSHRDETTGDFI